MSLLVGACTRGADIHFKTYEFLTHTAFNVRDAHLMIAHSPYTAAEGQEKLFQQFADGGYDHLLVVDADVVPPLDAYQRMVKHEKEIVIAPVWYYDNETNEVFYGAFRKWSDNHQEELSERIKVPRNTGLERIVSGGFGCMLVAKSVAQMFRNIGEPFVKWSKLLPEYMKERASDNIFWARCTRTNVKAYIDWSIKTIHYRTVGLSDHMINELRRVR